MPITAHLIRPIDGGGFYNVQEGETWLGIIGEIETGTGIYIFYASRSNNQITLTEIVKTSTLFTVYLSSSRPEVLDIAYHQTSNYVKGVVIRIA